MLDLMKIAVTGGVASGKSTVCQFFKELGAFVVSADAIVHELLDHPRSDLRKQVVQLLGIEKKTTDGRLLRKVIAEKVFKDPNLLTSLERILHPAVLKRIEMLYAETLKKGTHPYFVVEMPLLFEIRAQEFYDVVITVLADEEIAHKRFEKQGFLANEYEYRMKRQMNPLQKAKLSHYTIYNNGSLEELKKQVILINQTIRNYESRPTD